MMRSNPVAVRQVSRFSPGRLISYIPAGAFRRVPQPPSPHTFPVHHLPMQPERKANSSSLVGYAGLALGIIIMGYVLSTFDLEQAYGKIMSIGLAAFLILLPYLCLHLLETVAWRRLFSRAVGRVDFLRLFRIQLVSETISMTLPAGVAVAEPLRPWLCRRFMGIPLPDGFASVTVRKLMLGAAQGLYTIIGAAAGFEILQDYGDLGIVLLVAGAVVTVAFLTLLLMTVNGNAASSLHRLLVKIPFRKVGEWLQEREAGFAETDRKLSGIKSGGLVGLFTVMAMYVAAWTMFSVESYLILQLLGVDLTFRQVIAFDTAMLMLRSIVFFIPSGFGVQEIGYKALLHASGVSTPDLGAFLLLRRAKEIVWYAIGYLVMFLDGISLDDARAAQEDAA